MTWEENSRDLGGRKELIKETSTEKGKHRWENTVPHTQRGGTTYSIFFHGRGWVGITPSPFIPSSENERHGLDGFPPAPAPLLPF